MIFEDLTDTDFRAIGAKLPTALTFPRMKKSLEEIKKIDYICNNTSSFPEYSTNTGADVDPDRNAYYNGMNLERPTQQGTKLTLQNFLNASD